MKHAGYEPNAGRPLEELSWTSDGAGWRGAAPALGVESCVGHERTATAPRAGGELRRHRSEGGCALVEKDEGAGSPEGRRQKLSSSRSAVMLAKKTIESLDQRLKVRCTTDL